ncbi:helix-turn-helix transcriptional regulator [Sphingobacterium thalpophilum]|uniref:HTH luxR-type domain-containing protein n=1 Tax=Sphingobacterium thalpophilum TaxID=259 RepID=A0A4U9U8K7_9SPHI|nr:hypothetical protein [Sphingobacterium thalpophilum]VTR27572.1 Uncharacterised protein [Sphingobacterium thalpophilum]
MKKKLLIAISFLLLLLLFFAIKTIAWDSKKKEIDTILDKTRELQRTVKISAQLESALKALDLSDTYNYDEGKARAHYWAADALFSLGLFKEGFKHIEGLENTKYHGDDIEMQSETHREKGRGYQGLELYQQAIAEYRLQLACTAKLKGENQKKSYMYAFGNLSTVYDRLGKLDSVQKYLQLELEGLRDLDEKENVLMYVGLYDHLGSFYIKKADLVKAEYYLNKSLDLIERYKVPIFFNTMTYLSSLEQEKGNIKKSVMWNQRSLANMREVGAWGAVSRKYKYLAYFYRYYKLGDEQAREYELEHAWLRDSLEKQDKAVIDSVMIQLVKANEKVSAKKITSSVNISIVIFALLVAVTIFFVWRVRRNRKLLGQKEEALQETETINRELSEQIGENKFATLLELAKSNNPEFLALFTELYPEFIQSLKTLDPSIRSTELEFCAMAFLNFTAKNIAEYTFVTVRAVQVRKNRLRKKLGIPSDADFNNWMQELAQKNSPSSSES